MKGVSDALGRLDGAANVVVDLQSGLATITPAPGARLAPAALFDALRQAGFRGDAVTVEMTGEVKRSGGRAGFLLPGSGDPYLVLPEPAPADGPARVRVRVTPDGRVQLK